jgi:hypothetical protein
MQGFVYSFSRVQKNRQNMTDNMTSDLIWLLKRKFLQNLFNPIPARAGMHEECGILDELQE